MRKRFKPLKGHKLIRDWTGPASTYANGRCECGHWHSRGWTERMRSVILAHHGHVDRIRDGRGTPGFDLPELTLRQKAEREIQLHGGFDNAVAFVRQKVAAHHSWQSVLDELMRMAPEQ